MSKQNYESPEETLTVEIPSTLMRKLEKAIPNRQRSAFVAKVLEAKLDAKLNVKPDAKVRKRVIRRLHCIKRAPTNGENPLEVLRRFRRQFVWKGGKV